MANKNSYHIFKNQKGGWDVKKTGAVRSSKHATTKVEAVESATSMLKKNGGGEIIVHNADGQVTDRKEYVLTAGRGHYKISIGNVRFVHRDRNGRIISESKSIADKPFPEKNNAAE
jgi:hypothetical protein